MDRDVKQNVISELKTQRGIILPLIPMNSTWFAKTAITSAFLGRLGELELAAGTLGFTFANVTGFSILTGLCWAMEPICGQAHGAKNRKLLHRTLLMTVILLLLTSIPICFLWLYVDKILLFCGQRRDMTIVARKYVFYLLPDLLATCFLSPLRGYYTSQGITLPTMFTSGIAVVVHVPFNVILCKAKGIEGVALAVGLTDFVAAITLAVYLCVTEWKETDGRGWWEHRATEWLRLLRLSAQCCFSGCLEWWCYEILILLAGRLPEAQRSVAVLTIVLNFDYLLYGVMISIATCASTRVANELGAGEAASSRRAACVSLILSAAAGCIGGASMLSLKGQWGRFFSDDEGVVVGVRRMVPLMVAVELFNFPLGVCGGVVRGTTRPWLAMCSVGGFYLVGFPVAVGLAFRAGYGLIGLLMGFTAGAAASLVLLGFLVGLIDWVGEAEKAGMLAADRVGNRGETALELIEGGDRGFVL